MNQTAVTNYICAAVDDAATELGITMPARQSMRTLWLTQVTLSGDCLCVVDHEGAAWSNDIPHSDALPLHVHKAVVAFFIDLLAHRLVAAQTGPYHLPQSQREMTTKGAAALKAARRRGS